jgi:RimJ/RimL family protein N-acetyltransferase
MEKAVLLREVIESDLPILFEHQNEPEANDMAAFPARAWDAFKAHWRKLLADESIVKMIIIFDGQVAGNIVCFGAANEREVGYWIGKEYWGKGIATRALAAFLDPLTDRPLYAHVAKHNIGSKRVLEKCGFTISGEDKGFPYSGVEVEEFIMILE